MLGNGNKITQIVWCGGIEDTGGVSWVKFINDAADKGRDVIVTKIMY